MTPLSHGPDWTLELIETYQRAIADVAAEYRLDTYPTQVEIITWEQMLDAYTSIGMPVGYAHWSYGKDFISHERAYRKGHQGLAYEIVINSNPCIAYLMEENSMMMQALVVAHACYGHNSFFKGNYLFKQWTQPEGIIDFLVFAQGFVRDCEERHGISAVEEVLDAAHALADHGVHRYVHPEPLTKKAEKARTSQRAEDARLRYDDLWRTLPAVEASKAERANEPFPAEPEENVLYFVEQHSPKLEEWERKLVRIVRTIAQYFYPQGQTKVMNEGWATFWHYTILNTLYDRGLVDDGFMLEFLQNHTGVIAQRSYDQPGFSGINPYRLGFSMFQDVRRICERPTAEDRRWFPDLVDTDWVVTLDAAMRNFKDESFIGQYLSPHLIRELRLFSVADHSNSVDLRVDAIHDDAGYTRVRQLLARQHDRGQVVPDIQVQSYQRDGNRSLLLRHQVHRRRPLAKTEALEVTRHLVRLWGFNVRIESVNEDGTKQSYECNAP